MSNAEYIATYRRYFNGQFSEFQRSITDRQRQYVFQAEALGWNLCRKAVQSFANRLQLVNLSPLQEVDADVARQIWNWLANSRIDMLQKQLYEATIRDGAAYILAYFDQEPRITVHEAYDGRAGFVTVRDGTTNEVRMFQHFFQQEEADGLADIRVEYHPDRILVYREDELDSEQDWPLGFPVFEFQYPGGSKLHPLLGIQDLLNKSLMDLMEFADKAVYPTKFVFGASRSYDESTGEPIPFEVGPDVVWSSSNPADKDVQIGQLEPAPLDALKGVIDTYRKIFVEVGNLSPIDFMHFGTEAWSGIALATLESSFLAEVTSIQIAWGNIWEDIGRYLVKLYNAQQTGPKLVEDAGLDAQWKDPRVKDESFWNILQLKATTLGWSIEQIQREAGLTEEEIKRMASERALASEPRMRQVQSLFPPQS